jgi:hypothetical protein
MRKATSKIGLGLSSCGTTPAGHVGPALELFDQLQGQHRSAIVAGKKLRVVGPDLHARATCDLGKLATRTLSYPWRELTLCGAKHAQHRATKALGLRLAVAPSAVFHQAVRKIDEPVDARIPLDVPHDE